MNTTNHPKPKRRWCQGRPWTVLLGLFVLSGCGPSKEKQAIDAYDRGSASDKGGDQVKAEADPVKASRPVAFEIKDVGDATVVTFKGDNVALQGAGFWTVRDQVLKLAEQKGRKEFLLDLSNVRFIGEDVLGYLIALNKKIRSTQGRLRLCSLDPKVHEVLVLLRLDGLFDIEKDVDEALKAVARTRQEVQMIAALSAGELSQRWRKESLEYVAAVNEYVLRGLRNGWDQAGQGPEETRQPLAPRVLDAVREANKTGQLADLRERLPPAHSPFIDMLEANGQHLAPVALLEDGRIVLGIGYKNGNVVLIDGTKVEKVAGVLTFGLSPNRKYFAVARAESIDIHEGWGGPKAASLDWPKIGPLTGVQHVEQLTVFPDGQRVVLATRDAILAIELQRTELLYPRSIEKLQDNVGTIRLNNPHAAISPDGSLISIGDRLKKDSEWHTGKIAFPDGHDPDGSQEMMALFDRDPKSYKEFADRIYDDRLPPKGFGLKTISAIHAHEPLTEQMVAPLNPKLTLKDVKKDLADIGYPVEKKKMEAKVECPSAERVARRAVVLSLMMYRASLEHFAGQARYETLHRRLPEWIDRLGLASELEKVEYEFLRLPLGKADEKVRRNASWRNEGLGVLAWALKRYELPPYDRQVDPREAGAAVGFSEDLLSAIDTAAAQKL